MKNKIIRTIWHYAHSIECRLFLLDELDRLEKTGVAFPKGLRRDVWMDPGTAEDWVQFLRFIRPTDKIMLIDVGANVGEWFGKFMEIFPDTKTVAFEPTSAPFEKMESKFRGNPNIQLFPYAISNTNTKRQIFLGKSDGLSSFEKYAEVVNSYYGNVYQKTETVECRTLDSFGFQKGAGSCA